MSKPSVLLLFFIILTNADCNHAKYEAGSIQIPTRIVVGSPNTPGQFMASFRVGSPSQVFLLVADTGSHQTWMNCNYTCTYCPKRSVELRREKMFQARLSSTFKVVPCMSEFCDNVTFHNGCSGGPKAALAPCGYELRYGDGSTTRGIYANETAMVYKNIRTRQGKKLKNVLIGCTASVAGDLGGADGLLGLGNNPHSFATKTAKIFGNKFSYCWTDILKPQNNIKTYLNFGKKTPISLLPNMQYTELFLEQQPYYNLKIIDISINGTLLKIPSETWDFENRRGGFIIDSGLTLTVFMGPAYESIMTALKARLTKFEKVESKFSWGEGEELEFCFNATTGFKKSDVPKLEFHFTDGGKFVPPVRNYVVEVEHGVRCLAFYNGDHLGIHMNIIGSIMQQGYHWEYNFATKKLGFAPSTCA